MEGKIINNDISISALRAWQIFPILMKCAQNRQTITYEQLNLLLGYDNGKNTSLGSEMLSYIQKYCKEKQNQNSDFPLLTVIVVNKNTGIPGSGQITVHNAQNDDNQADYKQVLSEIEKVFKYDWSPSDYPENFADGPVCFEKIGKQCMSKS